MHQRVLLQDWTRGWWAFACQPFSVYGIRVLKMHWAQGNVGGFAAEMSFK